MLNNKKIFFYFVFVLNIIFFIKSADMRMDNLSADMAIDDDIFRKLIDQDTFIDDKILRDLNDPTIDMDIEDLFEPTLTDLELNELIYKLSKDSKLTDEEIQQLDQLIKKAINAVKSSKKLNPKEDKLLEIFWKKANLLPYRNFLFEKIPGQDYSYKFKNGEGIEGIISTTRFKGNDRNNESICDCGVIVTTPSTAMHMIQHSVFKTVMGCKECPKCKKIPIYVHPSYIVQHNNKFHRQ